MTGRKLRRQAKPGAATTAEKQQIGVPFKPRQSGNPAGRTKGARNKLGETFLKALHADFAEHGVTAIQATRTLDPAAYVRVIAGLLPKELKVDGLSDLTDEQLDARIKVLAHALHLSGLTDEPNDVEAAAVSAKAPVR